MFAQCSRSGAASKTESFMKQKITSEQRALIDQLIERGEDRHTIAQLASVTPGQVSAIMAHRTMRRSAGPVRSHETVSAAESASAESAELTKRSDQDSSTESVAIPFGMDKDTNRPVLWDPYAASNPHVLIVGESGS